VFSVLVYQDFRESPRITRGKLSDN